MQHPLKSVQDKILRKYHLEQEGNLELNDEVKKYIEQTVKDAISGLMQELRREHMLSGGAVVGGMTAFKKTEQLLYAFPKLLETVELKKEEIDELQRYGLRGKSTSIVEYSPSGGMVSGGMDIPSEVIKAKVEKIERDLEKLERTISRVEGALEKVKIDEYYDVIRMKYFDGMPYEAIGDEYGRDASTIQRNRSRLVNSLATYLFPTEKIDEIVWG